MSTRCSYSYTVKTVADARANDMIYVPNCSADEALQIWRWLSGARKDFPKYSGGGLLIVGIDEDAWCKSKVYREEIYCPVDMPCIVARPGFAQHPEHRGRRFAMARSAPLTFIAIVALPHDPGISCPKIFGGEPAEFFGRT
jgi:hypothetical protein